MNQGYTKKIIYFFIILFLSVARVIKSPALWYYCKPGTLLQAKFPSGSGLLTLAKEAPGSWDEKAQSLLAEEEAPFHS